ncbi:MAG: sigma-54 dependent transcriptional regulator [Humidesulfovibrio sp.]|uniref:sigma-54-dependent transcriptional regulator n=1 Tax=Humidesulfovibrio sp. TaxID=2910988 RepID=UPI002733A28E|nr:sigma-54 dependent transcriptional regulator [Humidesulfovibrio sp.]MDP2846785.1 sigma-54 dependent transcriptional regulator [Humidesulfovibrio sp.]
MGNILIIDDDAEVRETLLSLTRRMRMSGEAVGTLREGIVRLRKGDVDVAFLDVSLPDGNGLDALSEIKALPDSPEVIILTGRGDPDGAELAIQGGVWDYLLKPSPIKDTMLTLERALKYRTGKRGFCAPVALRLEDVVGKSQPMRACFDAVAGAAGTNASVLINGETGTGKELIARTIHTNSVRAAKPFVVVDCAALTETLVESTLFGHKKGAFTGADSDRVGLVKLADGGTLFLDEVGEMPINLQKAFLRVLQERRFRPVGANIELESDFRLMAATNRDLGQMVEQGGFRSDLLYRIKTISINLPPLRDRLEDVKPLCVFRVGQLCEQYGAPLKGFDPDVFQVLEGYDWPGNVRELFNVLERAFVAAGPERTLFAMHLPQDVRIRVAKAHLGRGRETASPPPNRPLPVPPPAASSVAATVSSAHFPPPAGMNSQHATSAEAPRTDLPQQYAGGNEADTFFTKPLKDCKEALERSYMETLVRRARGDVQRALESSGLSRSHLYALLKKWGLSIDGPGVGS